MEELPPSLRGCLSTVCLGPQLTQTLEAPEGPEHVKILTSKCWYVRLTESALPTIIGSLPSAQKCLDRPHLQHLMDMPSGLMSLRTSSLSPISSSVHHSFSTKLPSSSVRIILCIVTSGFVFGEFFLLSKFE